MANCEFASISGFRDLVSIVRMSSDRINLAPVRYTAVVLAAVRRRNDNSRGTDGAKLPVRDSSAAAVVPRVRCEVFVVLVRDQ
jgi:hypothetical protein